MTMAVSITAAAQKQVDGLPAKMQERLVTVIEKLADYPKVDGVKALKGDLKGTYRKRMGNYRVLFTVANSAVTITAVDDRKDVYK